MSPSLKLGSNDRLQTSRLCDTLTSATLLQFHAVQVYCADGKTIATVLICPSEITKELSTVLSMLSELSSK